MEKEQIMTKEDFAPHLNTIFKLVDQKTIDLKLFKIEEKDSDEVYSFTLLLEGPEEKISDNTYNFQHESMGNFSMFISAYTKKENNVLYESTFSKLKK